MDRVRNHESYLSGSREEIYLLAGGIRGGVKCDYVLPKACTWD